MKATKPWGTTACVFAICAFATSTALAQSATVRPDDTAADVGTGWNILSIPAAAFVLQRNQPGFEYEVSSEGYVYARAASGFGETITFLAPVQLPSGAVLGHLNLYAFNVLNNPFSGVFAQLRRLTGYGAICSGGFCVQPPVPPAFDELASVSTTGPYGYTLESALVEPSHTVANYRAQYVVLVTLVNSYQYGGLAFKGVDIWWKRQISPAPATASFTDVPTNAQFFAEIEAMKAAGITSGCTATKFCPDSNVTRRQMAAFFARALGLYWQY